MNILFLCDMHISRPWVRDRLPGLMEAANLYAYKMHVRDIYEIFGSEVSSHLREHTGRDQKLFLPNISIAEKHFKTEIEKYDIDTIIFATADNYRDFLSLDFIMYLKAQGYHLVGFLGDDEFNHPQYKYLAAVFDNFVVYVDECRLFYEKVTQNKGHLLLNSCHINNFDELMEASSQKYDTVLIGGPIKARVKVLRKIKEEGYSIAIYGPKSWEHIPDLAENYLGFVDSEDFDKRLAEGKVILSMLEDHITGKKHMNTKIWECARAGAFTIATNYEPLFSDYGFEETVDIVTYSDEADLLSKFRYYIKNDAEREKVRLNFLRKVKNELDYEILYLDLFKRIHSDLRPINTTDYVGAHKHLNSNGDNYLGIYYNIINDGYPVKQYFPFICCQSIVNYEHNFNIQIFNYIYFLLKRRKYYHVNLYIEVSGQYKMISLINYIIHTWKYKYIKPFYQKYLLPIKKKIISA